MIGVSSWYPNSCGEQEPRPAAEEVETRMPSGSVIVTSLTCAVASSSGSSLCGTESCTSSPVGAPASSAVGATLIEGSNGRSAHLIRAGPDIEAPE